MPSRSAVQRSVQRLLAVDGDRLRVVERREPRLVVGNRAERCLRFTTLCVALFRTKTDLTRTIGTTAEAALQAPSQLMNRGELHRDYLHS